jgi:phosphate transport system substrate-binding protein
MKKNIYALMILLIFNPLIATTAQADGDIFLTGVGATFPQPLYELWIERYQSINKVKISYLGVGSGQGIKELFNQTVDFGATDAFLTDEELSQAPGEILHLPTCIGAVAIIYNLPGYYALKLSQESLSRVFSGKTTRWTDELITDQNSGASIPNLGITLVHRSDSSGTTYILTEYLSKVDPAWKDSIGQGKQVRWPAGIGVEKNQGVAETVAKIPGSIGYVELTYAKNHALPMALIRNKSGNYIMPSIESASKAAKIEISPDTRIMITDTDEPEGYPISAFTWLIFYQNQEYGQRSLERVRALSEFFWWIIHEGQAFNASIHYSPLPDTVVLHAEKIIQRIAYQQKPVFGATR